MYALRTLGMWAMPAKLWYTRATSVQAVPQGFSAVAIGPSHGSSASRPVILFRYRRRANATIVPECSTKVPVIGVRRQRRARSRYARAVRDLLCGAGCVGGGYSG